MVQRRVVLRAGIGLFAAVLAGRSHEAIGQTDPVWDRLTREKKLRVHAVQFPPQTYRDQEGGEWKGFDADVFRYVARRLGVELEVVWTTTAAMIPTLTSGRSDMGVALYRTPEREKVVDFTMPYKWVGDHVIVHADDRETTSLETLKGKVIGAPRGTAEELAARKIQESGYARDVRVHDTVDAMFRDLNAKRVDAIVYQTIYFQWVLTQNPDLKGRLAFEVDPKFFGRTERSPSQFPVRKGAARLTEAVIKIIVDMRE
jgi:ABC-type amino acid transport substrate-binding protein